MAVRNILVQIDDDSRNSVRITLAANLAERHGAHLTGLFAYACLPGTYPYVEGVVGQEMLRRYEAATHETADKLRAEFEYLATSAGLSHEWRMKEEAAQPVLATQARYADFAVVSQTADRVSASRRSYDLAEEVVMVSGSPIIVVPYAGTFDDAVEKVVIAWNGSRECSRAVRDAMPVLRVVDEVTLFSVNPDHDHLPGTEIASYLARHGVKTEVRHTIVSEIDVGDAILNAVSDHAADLLVMGAYGHARLREFVFGGATRHILRHMTAPTLLSH